MSTAGGMWPRWRRDGKEIFYVAADNKLMAASIDSESAAFHVRAVQPMFEIRPRPSLSAGWVNAGYDFTANGERFLVNMEEASTAPPTLLVNWPSLLSR